MHMRTKIFSFRSNCMDGQKIGEILKVGPKHIHRRVSVKYRELNSRYTVGQSIDVEPIVHCTAAAIQPGLFRAGTVFPQVGHVGSFHLGKEVHHAARCLLLASDDIKSDVCLCNLLQPSVLFSELSFSRQKGCHFTLDYRRTSKSTFSSCRKLGFSRIRRRP